MKNLTSQQFCKVARITLDLKYFVILSLGKNSLVKGEGFQRHPERIPPYSSQQDRDMAERDRRTSKQIDISRKINVCSRFF